MCAYTDTEHLCPLLYACYLYRYVTSWMVSLQIRDLIDDVFLYTIECGLETTCVGGREKSRNKTTCV